MSPEMFTEPDKASYPSDLWSLGVTLFELATGRLPFEAESDMLWGVAIAGDMYAEAPNLMDCIGDESRRARFDNNLARVVARALRKRASDRYQSVDEMHEAVYSCLIHRGEAFYSCFISYRVASEAPLARLLFDELNHSVTPGGHRVTVYWDAHRLVKGEDWEEGFSKGLLHSLCIFPLLSYGATAPMAELTPGPVGEAVAAAGWGARPCGRGRLRGAEDDPEDNVLKELLIAAALLDRRDAANRAPEERGMLQLAFPVLVGRMHPAGHPDYPGMGDFFQVQAGGGKYPSRPSPPTARAVGRFLRDKARLPYAAAGAAEARGVAAAVQAVTALQGCQLWAAPPGLTEVMLHKEQLGLVGTGYAGPPVDLPASGGGAAAVALTDEQRRLCCSGLDQRHLQMLKALIRANRQHFHEVIDRAVAARGRTGPPPPPSPPARTHSGGPPLPTVLDLPPPAEAVAAGLGGRSYGVRGGQHPSRQVDCDLVVCFNPPLPGAPPAAV